MYAGWAQQLCDSECCYVCMCLFSFFFSVVVVVVTLESFCCCSFAFFFSTVCFLIVIEVTLFFFFNFSVHMYGFCSLFYLQITCFLLLLFFFFRCFLFSILSLCIILLWLLLTYTSTWLLFFLLFSFFLNIFTSKPKQIESGEKRQTLPLFKSDILLLFWFTCLFFACFFFFYIYTAVRAVLKGFLRRAVSLQLNWQSVLPRLYLRNKCSFFFLVALLCITFLLPSLSLSVFFHLPLFLFGAQFKKKKHCNS